MSESPTPPQAETPRASEAEPLPAAPASGSEVRDHLANERTYLAWLRTTMGLLGLAFLVARLRLELVPPAAPAPGGVHGVTVALGFAVLGVGTLLFATQRYLAVRRMIETQRFAPLGGTVIAISAAALVVAGLVLLYLLHQLGS